MNPFLSATRKSFVKLDEIATDHKVKLSSRMNEPGIAQMYQRFLPTYNAFKNQYLKWKSSNFDQVAATDKVANLLEDFSSTHLNRWDAYLQFALGKGSYEYRRVMHGGRSALHVRKIESRINAISVLVERLSLYPQLTLIHDEASTFLSTLLEAREMQKEAMERKRFASIELHDLREQLCGELFRNLGNLIMLYPFDPDMITHFFRMESIRRTTSPAVESQSVDSTNEEESLPTESLDSLSEKQVEERTSIPELPIEEVHCVASSPTHKEEERQSIESNVCMENVPIIAPTPKLSAKHCTVTSSLTSQHEGYLPKKKAPIHL